MIRSGARGRGATDGNASAGLLKASSKSASLQTPSGTALQARISKLRSAENRFWGGFSSALTCTRLTWIGESLSASWTVTCRPATGAPSDSHCVDSVSSIRLAWAAPSPAAVAPRAAEARLAASAGENVVV
jgi:hypothetical protein